MRIKIPILLIILTLFILPKRSTAQNTYRVGSAQRSIDPPASIFSVSLAGYGAPREGRFSLEWVKQEHPARYDHLFRAKRVPTLIKTKKIRAFEIQNKEMIIVDEEGVVRKSPKGKNLLWQKLGSTNAIIDLAASDTHLYALTNKNEILQYQADGEWLRIAIQNGLTYKQDIKQISISNNLLYGIDASGTVFLAQHRTDNNLTVHALSINDEKKEHVVLTALDLCGFDDFFIREVKKDIEKKYSIPASAILINASHTHFAPVSQNWTTWGHHCQKPDSTYLYGTVKPAIIASIGAAIKSEAKANIYFGRGTATIGANRSLKQDPIPYDNEVDVIKVEYGNKSRNDILFMHGCHPVFNNQGEEGVTISANYPAIARNLLNQDPTINNSIFMQGCAGDINPVDSDHRITGKKLANAVQQILDSNLTPITGSIHYHMDTINFAVKPWPIEDLISFRQQNSAHEGDVAAEKNVRWSNLMLEHLRKGTMPKQMPVYVQTVNIGNWKLVGLSREVVTEYSIGIKKIWPGQLVSVAGYSNDVSSYLPTRRHIHAGVYEGNDSFFWYGQPNIFPENVYETIIEAIQTKNR